VEEVAKAAAVAVARFVLPAAGFAEVGDGGEFSVERFACK
jgi:hypothetical protein